MPLETQTRVLQLIESAMRRRLSRSVAPDWLVRPGRDEMGHLWRTFRLMYRRLTDGMELPDNMPFRERRSIDGLMGGRGQPSRLIEIDERQHFNEFRLITLRLYPKDARVAYPLDDWIASSRHTRAIRGGGWAKPKPPLFPMDGGRHRQRAFRDALADLLPPIHGFAPTLRVSESEVQGWMYDRGAVKRMRTLLDERLGEPAVTCD
jgi:hypothetical protein